MPWTQMPRVEKPPRPAPMRPSRINPPKPPDPRRPPKPPDTPDYKWAGGSKVPVWFPFQTALQPLRASQQAKDASGWPLIPLPACRRAGIAVSAFPEIDLLHG